MTLSSTFGSSLDSLVPESARDLALELQTTLEGTGSHATLKLTSALAAALLLRDPALFRGLATFADTRGNVEARTRALAVATQFVHPGQESSRDALTRLVTAALERGLRMAPSARAERVDPLLHTCTDVVELVNALSISRFSAMMEDNTAIPSSEGKRRQTRDFEMTPLSTPEPGATAPTRSTMRPSPPRSTMRPTATRGTLRPPAATGTVDDDAVIVPRTQVRDQQGRPLKKKW